MQHQCFTTQLLERVLTNAKNRVHWALYWMPFYVSMTAVVWTRYFLRFSAVATTMLGSACSREAFNSGFMSRRCCSQALRFCLALAASGITQTKVSLARTSQHTQRVLETAAKSSDQVNVSVPCLVLTFAFVKKADQRIADADHQFFPLNTADQDPILF